MYKVDLKKADSWLLAQFRDHRLPCRAIQAMVTIDKLGEIGMKMKVEELEAAASFLVRYEKNRPEEPDPELALQVCEMLRQAAAAKPNKVIPFGGKGDDR